MKFHQRGNAMIYILVAIFLFAALAYTLAKSGKSGQGSLTAQQAKLAASDILGYTATVAKSVDRLRQKGCSEQQISFENTLDSVHTNPSAPVSKECHVFDAAGAGLSALAADSAWFIPAAPAKYFIYASGDSLTNVGTDCAGKTCTEINVTLKNISKTLCDALNTQLNLSLSPIPADTLQGCPFDGTFDCTGAGATLVFAGASLKGKHNVCYNDTVTDYTFVGVLVER